jgi:hypothetical protein
MTTATTMATTTAAMLALLTGPNIAAPAAQPRAVTWSGALAGPARPDLDKALDARFDEPWDTHLVKRDEQRLVTSCRAMVALPAAFEPVDPSELAWNAFRVARVHCHVIALMTAAVPARVDHLGALAPGEALLGELPAILHPLAGPKEQIARLRAASASGTSWKRWDPSVHVAGKQGDRVTVIGKDIDCLLQVLGRGDLDGDGIEDVVLLRSGGGRRGSWSSIQAFVLTRRGPGQSLEVLREIN